MPIGLIAGLLAGGGEILGGLGGLLGIGEAAGAAAIPAAATGAALDTGAAAGALDLGGLLAGGAAPTVAGADLTGMTLSPFATGALDTGMLTTGAAGAAPAFAAADAIAPSAVIGGDFAALGFPEADIALPGMTGGVGSATTSALAAPTGTGISAGLQGAAPAAGAGANAFVPFGSVAGENAANVGSATTGLINTSSPVSAFAATPASTNPLAGIGGAG